MKTLKQLLRQPLKYLSGILLLTLAVAVLCVCVGQSIAARTTEQALIDRFTTIAIPRVNEKANGDVDASTFLLDDELLSWLEQTAAENPDVVKEISRAGMLSAYIPELTPWNLTSEKHITDRRIWDNYKYYNYQSSPYFMPYSCAMFVITLDEAPKITEYSSSIPYENKTMEDFATKSDYYEWLFMCAEGIKVPNSCTIELTGTVTSVVSLQEGYQDPTGMTARLAITVPTSESLEAYDLVPGEQYIVYGMNYVNEHWKLIGALNYDGRYDHIINFETYNESWLRVLSDEEKKIYEMESMRLGREYLKYIYARYNGIDLTEQEYKQLNSISMNLNPPVTHTLYNVIRDEETGKLIEAVPRTDVTYTDANGQEITLSNEEYTAIYQIPTIARLEGSVEDFLNSAEGVAWKEALARDEINNHAFAVIGVDKLNYLADFAQQNSQIVSGRDFTSEELGGGQRVCIINETLALENGLQIGDTINLNFYSTDYGLPYQKNPAQGYNLLNPSASIYFDTTPFTETGEYTIVGFYRSELLWPDVARVSEYAFSANTVFVPRSSVQSQMEQTESIVFVSAVLENGKMEQFQTLANQAALSNRFRYADQGYSVIAENFHNYQELGRQVLQVGAAVYVILLLLYLLLYPITQRKNVHTMQSLGAHFGKRFAAVLTSSVAVLIPASVLGGFTGLLLWDKVVAALQASAESTIALQLEPEVLVMIAAVQLALALLINICVALFVAVPRGMSSRR